MALTDCSQVFYMHTVYPDVAMGTHPQGPSWGLGGSRLWGPGMEASSASGAPPPSCWGPVPSTLRFVWMMSSQCGCHLLLTPNLKEGLLFSPIEPCFPLLGFFTIWASI